ncbi:hypothetical protein [Burkholderia multivorans]|uniref:hypothetical protein n=1 Tax=Burkholderia multivorans TaxID=87883 RepID=UPI00057E28C7|nr:hypothetical protein [Burkholderia multivorans]KHS09414.1 hypothetical protein BMD20_29520 [Burkholderia multivorans]KHS10389.1 hypothetical protein BMD22_28305 [Burkholderia multivorans]MDR9230033.1 hypothetical protein [Burkholderia multivorans]HDR9474398.1 hypothetical protein [Burkholderia multivorans]HDR9480240.1 hypothetical protein [Burkholderia multivorans]
MVLQALGAAAMLIVTFQMMMFIWSSEASLIASYVDSWRKTGKVLAHLFQIQTGPGQWIGIVAFSLVGFYLAIAAAIEIGVLLGQ